MSELTHNSQTPSVSDTSLVTKMAQEQEVVDSGTDVTTPGGRLPHGARGGPAGKLSEAIQLLAGAYNLFKRD